MLATSQTSAIGNGNYSALTVGNRCGGMPAAVYWLSSRRPANLHVCGKHGVSLMPGHPHAPRSNTGSGAYAIQVIAGHSDLGDATVASTLPTNLNLQSLTIGTGGLTVTGATK